MLRVRSAGCKPEEGLKEMVMIEETATIKSLKADLKSIPPPSRVVSGLGSDSIIVFPAKDRIIVGEDQCK